MKQNKKEANPYQLSVVMMITFKLFKLYLYLGILNDLKI